MNLILLSTTIVSFGCIGTMVSRKMPLLMAVPENLINESFVIRPSKAMVVWQNVVHWVVEKYYIIWILFIIETVLGVFHFVFSGVDGLFNFFLKRVRAKRLDYVSHSEAGYWRYPSHWKKAADKKTETAVVAVAPENLPLVDISLPVTSLLSDLPVESSPQAPEPVVTLVADVPMPPTPPVIRTVSVPAPRTRRVSAISTVPEETKTPKKRVRKVDNIAPRQWPLK